MMADSMPNIQGCNLLSGSLFPKVQQARSRGQAPNFFKMLPSELLIGIFKYLNLNDHKSLNLASKKFAQFSFYKQIPIALALLQGKQTAAELIFPYLHLIDRQIAGQLLKRSKTSVSKLLDDFYQQQYQSLPYQLYQLILNLLPFEYLQIEKLLRLPSSFFHYDHFQIQAAFKLARLETDPAQPIIVKNLLQQVTYPYYLTLCYQGRFIIDILMRYILLEPANLLTDRNFALQFLQKYDQIRANNLVYAAHKVCFSNDPIYEILNYLRIKFNDDPGVIKAVLKINGHELANVKDSFKEDREIALIGIKQSGSSLQFVSDLFKNDEDFVFTALIDNDLAYDMISEEIKTNFNLILETVRHNGIATSQAIRDLINDRAKLLKILEVNGLCLRYAQSPLKDCKKIILTAIHQTGLALEFAPEKFKGNRRIVSRAIVLNGMALQFADKKFQNSIKIVSKAVKQNGLALQHTTTHLKNSRKVVLLAIKQNGMALQFAGESLKEDKEIVLAAIEQSPHAFIHALKYFKDDREVVLNTLKQWGGYLRIVNNFQDDLEIVQVAVSHTGHSLKHASKRLKNHKKVVLAAVINDPNAYQYASPALQQDEDIKRAAGLMFPSFSLT